MVTELPCHTCKGMESVFGAGRYHNMSFWFITCT